MFYLFKYHHEKWYLNTITEHLRTSNFIFSCWHMNKLSINYWMYLRTWRIDAFGQEIRFCHNSSHNRLCIKIFFKLCWRYNFLPMGAVITLIQFWMNVDNIFLILLKRWLFHLSKNQIDDSFFPNRWLFSDFSCCEKCSQYNQNQLTIKFTYLILL